MNHMFLIIIDAHSKWPEVVDFRDNTKADKLIEKFRSIFARHGLPNHMVTDNGPQFASEAFGKYLKRLGIKHTFSPPYHPATNEAAENFVGILKDKVKKIIKGGRTLEDAINIFLFDYRSVKHSTTGKSPAFLMLKRELRTRFDLLRPRTENVVYDKQHDQIISRKGSRNVSFEEGDTILTDNYGKGKQKLEGTIAKQLSPSTFEIQVEPEKVWKRHTDQIISVEPKIVPLRRSKRLMLKDNKNEPESTS